MDTKLEKVTSMVNRIARFEHDVRDFDYERLKEYAEALLTELKS